MDKALAAIAAVRNAIIDTVNAYSIPPGGRIHMSTIRAKLGDMRVRQSDFTDAMSSLVQGEVFRTHVDSDGLLLELTEHGATIIYAPPSLPRPSDWIDAFRRMRTQRDILRRPAANDDVSFGRRAEDHASAGA